MKPTKQVRRDAKQLYRFCLADGLLDESRVRLVLQKVSQAGRRKCPAILWQFRRLVKMEIARLTATVESAAPLPVELQTSVQADLERVYGPGLKTSFAVNPALIGGMRIKAGGDVYDSSIQARLVALEGRL